MKPLQEPAHEEALNLRKELEGKGITITEAVDAKGKAVGILYYLGQQVDEVSMGTKDAPIKVEEYIKEKSIEGILEETKLMRMFALHECITQEAERLKTTAVDEYFSIYDKEHMEEEFPETEAVIPPTIEEIYPVYELDTVVDRLHTLEAVQTYAKEHGRIEAGFGWKGQRLHADTQTGSHIKTWMQRLQEAGNVKAGAIEAANKEKDETKLEKAVAAEFNAPELEKERAPKENEGDSQGKDGKTNEKETPERKALNEMLKNAGKTGGRVTKKASELAEEFMDEGRML